MLSASSTSPHPASRPSKVDGQLVELRQHPATISPQQLQPSRTFGVAQPDQVDKVAYLLNGHARSPQPQHHVQQAKAVPVEDAMPAAVPVHRAEQPSSVVGARS
jgi:hypothetical protein